MSEATGATLVHRGCLTMRLQANLVKNRRLQEVSFGRLTNECLPPPIPWFEIETHAEHFLIMCFSSQIVYMEIWKCLERCLTLRWDVLPLKASHLQIQPSDFFYPLILEQA